MKSILKDAVEKLNQTLELSDQQIRALIGNPRRRKDMFEIIKQMRSANQLQASSITDLSKKSPDYVVVDEIVGDTSEEEEEEW